MMSENREKRLGLFDLQFADDDRKHIVKPNELKIDKTCFPPLLKNEDLLNRIKGSMFGMGIGDALGAHVEFRPRAYLEANLVTDLQGGGTWGLEKGQFTDDTSMGLCLANSLIVCEDFIEYDQLVRYKWWYRYGYMSSTGHCFDIGGATRQSIQEFEKRQREFSSRKNIPFDQMDCLLLNNELVQEFDVNCSKEGVAGNGALMRLGPVPLFFYQNPEKAVEYSGRSGKITHGDDKSIDACRYYGALIVAALHGEKKENLLSKTFYRDHLKWFGERQLHPEIMKIAEGSYMKENGYEDGIRGKGYVVNALEAALWAFWSDENSFEKGVLNAVNLGDDTDTTAAIYGQLAGAYYGFHQLPNKWSNLIYAKHFIDCVSHWIAFQGNQWFLNENKSLINSSRTSESLKKNFSLMNNLRLSSSIMLSLDQYLNIMERKSIDSSIHIGYLYDGWNDSFINSSNSYWAILNKDINPVRRKCVFEKGENIGYKNLLDWIGFDDQLRLSIRSGIVSPQGIAAVIEYPFLIDEYTRILYYSSLNRREIIKEDSSRMKQMIKQMKKFNEASHIIKEINWGIDLIVILRLSFEETSMIDQTLEEICKSLNNNEKFPSNLSFDGILSTHIYSNICELSKQSTLIDVYHQIQKNENLIRPMSIILHPLHELLTDEKDKCGKVISISSEMVFKIEEHLLRLSSVNKRWEMFLHQHISEQLNVFLVEQLNDAQTEAQKLELEYTKEKERLQKLILQVRRREIREEKLIDEEKWKKLRYQIDDFEYTLTNLKEKDQLIHLLNKRGFDYYNVSNIDFHLDDNDQMIEHKLIKNPNEIYLCSNDILYKQYPTQFQSLSSQMLEERKSNGNLHLIYADYSFSSYQLNQMKVIPSRNSQEKIIRKLSVDYIDESQDISSNDQIINLLLLGKTRVGKSTLINQIGNFLKTSDISPTKLMINVIVSFLYSIKNEDEEHFIQIGPNDFNEDHNHPGQSITQHCKSYLFNIGNKQKLRLIDTPGFDDLRGHEHDQLIMEEILSFITDLKYLNGICLLFRSDDKQLNTYERCLIQLLNYFGNDINRNLLFCFTDNSSISTSNSFSINERIDSFKLILQSVSLKNLSLNEENIFVFDSSYFVQSISERYCRTLVAFDRGRSNESMELSQKEWKRLFNYVRNTLPQYYLYQGLQKAEYIRSIIIEMIRPILETIRNNYRNLLLCNEGYSKGLIKLNPKSLLHHYTICYSCKRSSNEYNSFWITSDSPHQYLNNCDTCHCPKDEHMKINYRLEYQYTNNRTDNQFQSIDSIQKFLFRSIVDFTRFLSELSSKTKLDQSFLIYINRMIDEERHNHEKFASSRLNSHLYHQLLQFKQNYIQAIQRKSTEKNLHIDHMIDKVKNVPMVKLQMDVARQIRETAV